jgi:ubiquinone/menaquinone biosynthesis C-methylase UbiE/uncharacterized protein YbaR (Trm112 family)
MHKQALTTASFLEEILACPACHGRVVRCDDSYRCDECARRFPIRYGIPDFRLQPDQYISVEREIAKVEGFTAPGRSFADMVRAYYFLTPESPANLHSRYLEAMDASVTRGAGIVSKLQEKFPDSRRDTLLDLGCGTAGMTIAASRSYTNVVGVDVALRWLVMGRQRLDEAGIDVPLICANAEALPLKAGVFDAVVADSVIEHVRDSARMRDETLRVLGPRGAFFFVTNNRFSVLPEPHLRIPLFGLLPRKVMETVSWALRKTPYKAKLHSRRELRKLFKGKGEVLLPYYSEGELGQHNESLRRRWESLRASSVFRALAGALVPQFFIAGSPSSSRPPEAKRQRQ